LPGKRRHSAASCTGASSGTSISGAACSLYPATGTTGDFARPAARRSPRTAQSHPHPAPDWPAELRCCLPERSTKLAGRSAVRSGRIAKQLRTQARRSQAASQV